jgi:hypothetical protein
MLKLTQLSQSSHFSYRSSYAYLLIDIYRVDNVKVVAAASPVCFSYSPLCGRWGQAMPRVPRIEGIQKARPWDFFPLSLGVEFW